MNDSVFVKHEPCPKCGSRDNLGVWSDGHKWCFGCGYYVKPDGTDFQLLKSKLEKSQEKTTVTQIQLPYAAQHGLGNEAKVWLTKYGIHPKETAKYGFRWDPEQRSLIMPIYDDEQRLIFYQERNFNPDIPWKYRTHGNLGDHLPVFGADSDNDQVVVVVEDYISAIKVSRMAPAMPLFGSFLHRQKAVRLSYRYHRLCIWLDADKQQQAIKFLEQYEALFDNTAVVIVPGDPKDYKDPDILEHVWGNFDYELET